MASQLVSVTVLTRLLPPKSYGVMALATIATNLANVFRDLGSSAAIIQTDRLNPRLIGTVHFANVALGLLIGACVAVSAPLLAIVFREPELTRVLLILAAVFPLGSLSLVHQALLERESRFPIVVSAEIVAAVVSLALALSAAWAGAGVYSLVLQVFSATAIATVIIVVRSRARPRWIWSRDEFSAMIGFSGHLSAFNLVAYLARNTDAIVVGRALGSVALGTYSVAYRIMILPLQNLTFVSSRALFPLMSRQGDRRSETAELYLKSLALIAFLSAPVMAGLFATRELFVTVVLGERWLETARILAWLAPVGAIQCLVSSTGTISMATGRTDVLLRLGVLGATLQTVGFIAGAHWGVEGVAAGYFVATILNAAPAFIFSGRLIDVRLWSIVKRIGPSLLLAMVMALALRMGTPAVAVFTSDPKIQLLILVLSGAVFYGIVSFRLLTPQWASFRNFLRLSA